MSLTKHSKMLCLVLLGLFSVGNTEIQSSLNPGCDSVVTNCTKPYLILVHTTSPSHADEAEIYHLWSAADVPSVTVIEVEPNTTLKVEWGVDGVEAVIPSTPVLTVFGVAVTQLVLFNDTHDTGSISDSTVRFPVATSRFGWQAVDLDVKSIKDESSKATKKGSEGVQEQSVSYSLKAVSLDGVAFAEDVSFSLELNTHDMTTRQEAKPSLLVKPTAFSLSMVLDNFELDLRPNASLSDDGPKKPKAAPISGLSHPRWAVRLTVGSSEARTKEGLLHTVSRSLDDEYAPGVFKLDDISTPASLAPASQHRGGYLQYRPVAYLSPNLDITNSTRPNLSPTSPNHTTTKSDFLTAETGDEFSFVKEISEDLAATVLYKVLGENMSSTLLAEETFVSFGMKDDGFYNKWHYTQLTMTVGAGEAPAESMSTAILVVVVCGLGLPVVALVVAGVGWAVFKARRGGAVLLIEEEEDVDVVDEVKNEDEAERVQV